jgi:hypothetical protein
MDHATVHMLWVKGPLPRLARLSLASFLKQGFAVTLWTYDRASLAGSPASLRDAADLLPLAGDMAVLSSLFRYRLLAEVGGLWSDMDVVALAGAGALPTGPFVAAEKRRPFRAKEATATGEGLTQVTNCFMGNPAPRDGDLWHRAAAAVEELKPEERDWEHAGPHLLSRLMLETPGHGVTILPPDEVDPVAWWNVPGYFLEAREAPQSPFMHMYNSIWSRRDVDPEAPFPEGSLVDTLCRAHGV